MAGINFLSDNYVDNADLSITTGSENAQFPLNNILNESPSVKFRSVGNTVVVLIDMTTTRTVDALALVGDSVGEFGVTDAEFKLSLTTDFSGSTAYDLDLNAENNIGYLLLSSAETARYAQLTLTGNGSFSEVSNIFVGEKVNLPNMNISISSFKYYFTENSKINKNKYGQRFIDTRNKVKHLAGGMDFLNKTEQDEIDTIIVRHGNSQPIWVIVDEDGTSMTDSEFKLSMYGYFTKLPQWSANGNFHYSTTIDIEEAI